MSVEAREWAKQVLRGRSDLPESSKRLLECLADMHNPKYGGCFPNNRHLMSVLGKARASVQRNLLILESEGLLKRLTDEKRTILLPVDEAWGASQMRRGEPHQRGGGASRMRRGGLNPEIGKPVDSVGKVSSNGDLAAATDNRKGKLNGKVKGKGKGEVSFGALSPTENPPMKVEDVLNRHGVCESPDKAVREFRAAMASGKPPNGTTVWKLWRDLVSAHHPKVFLKQPSNVQLAQLKSLYTATTDELPDVLSSVVGEWTWFIKYVKENAGTALWKEDRKAGYTIPNIGFVIKYLELAVNFHRLECQPTPETREGPASRLLEEPHQEIASRQSVAPQAQAASPLIVDTPVQPASHTTTDTPVDVALRPLEDAREAAESHSASDIRSQRAGQLRSDDLSGFASRPSAAPRNDDASHLARDDRNENASRYTLDTHLLKADLQSVANSAVKQVVEPKEKTLTNKLEGGQIESDEARRRKEALEILKRY